MTTEPCQDSRFLRTSAVSGLLQGAGLLALAGIVALSAIITKEVNARGRLPALVAMDDFFVADEQVDEVDEAAVPEFEIELIPIDPLLADASLRWFNGRPVRPARTIRMTVTAYSPDAQSCAPFADGKTASLHSVHTNAMKLVAADTRLLPIGSMLSIPGYDDGQIVPVLDRGGAIKGHRLDVLFPTHKSALKWGVRKLDVTVWEYADGLPADDWRKIRDSRH